MREVAGHVSPHTPALLPVRVVDGVGGVEVLAVLRQNLREDDVSLVPVDIVVGVAIDKQAGQSGVSVDIQDQIWAVQNYLFQT